MWLRLWQRWGGGGIKVVGKQIYVEKRRVSFMYFIVAKIIFLLSLKFMVWWPYRYRRDWFPRPFRLYFCRICIILLAKVILWSAKKGHENKKWLVSSIPWLQRHLSEGVSMKLWRFLWCLNRLRPTLNWRRYQVLQGHVYQMFFSSDESKIQCDF